MSEATQIDYGSHAPVAGVIDYGSHVATGAEETKALPSVPRQIMTSIQNQAKGLFETVHAAFDPRAQAEMGDRIVGAQLHEWNRAKENYAKGDYLGAVTGALGAAVPILGPMINQTADKLATPGQRAEGATDLAVPLLLGGASAFAPEAGAIAEGAGNAARAQVGPLLKGTNPLLHPLKVLPDIYNAGQAVIEGGKQGLADYQYSQTPKGPSARYAGPPPVPSELPELTPIQADLPSGRRPGGFQNQQAQTPKGPSAPSELDVIAKDLGAKNYSEADAATKRVADAIKLGKERTAAARAPQATEKPAVVDISPQVAPKTPAEVPAGKEAPPSDLTQKLNDLLRKVKIEGGFDPDKPLGEVKGGRYLAKFDEGGGEAPVIQSQLRKPTSGVEPANPSLIAKDIGQKLAGRITVEQFDSMAKNPKALAVITRQYGVEADPDLIAMIRRRIKAKTADVPSNSVISIADLMRTK